MPTTIQELIANNPDILQRLGIIPADAPSTPIPMAPPSSTAVASNDDTTSSDDESDSDRDPASSTTNPDEEETDNQDDERIDEDAVPKSPHHLADMSSDEINRLSLDRSPETGTDSTTDTPSDVLQFGSGKPAGLSQEDLNRASLAELGNGLGGAAATFGAALAKVPENKAAQEAFVRQQQDAANIPAQLQQRLAINEDNDPNSKSSLALRGILDRMGVKYTGTPSAAQLKLALPYVFKEEEARRSAEAKKEVAKYRVDSLNQRSLANAQGRQDKLNQKASIDQAKAYERLEKNNNTFRGNTAVQQAAAGLKNSEAAMAIINSKPNLNDLDVPQYNTLTSEIAKIATGGAATEASAHDMRANTLKSKAAEFWQRVKGKPTPAQLGAFIQENKDYLQHLDEINHRYVDEYKANNYRGLRGQMSPDDRQEWEEANPGPMAILRGGHGGLSGNGNATPTFSPEVQAGALAELARRQNSTAPPQSTDDQ